MQTSAAIQLTCNNKSDAFYPVAAAILRAPIFSLMPQFERVFLQPEWTPEVQYWPADY